MEGLNYETILNNLHDGLYIIDSNRVITHWNKAAEEITGYSAEEVLGRSCSENILTHVDDQGVVLCHGMCPLMETMHDCERRKAEVYLHHKKGQRIPVSVRVSALVDPGGNVIGGVELFSDISNRASNELRIKELEKLAYLDNLTQLANRHYLMKELELKFEEFKRYELPFGVLLMDIDHFKQFNDNYGHDVGDLVLQAVANTCMSNSRSFDLYGRWGGEEFIGIIRNVDRHDLEVMGNRLRLLIKNSYIMYNDEKLQVTASIGATVAESGDNIDSLLKRADNLLYDSKNNGRDLITAG